MKKILSAARSREVDRRAIEEFQIEESILMENAGIALADACGRFIEPESAGRSRISIFIGKGNNGADGSVAARHLYNRGFDPTVFLVGSRDDLKGLARRALDIYIAIGGRFRELRDAESMKKYRREYIHSVLMVDALLGTGSTGQLSELYALAVQMINKYGQKTIAVDIPTGLDADSPSAASTVTRADLTVTFGAFKVCHFFGDAAEFCGQVKLDQISIPDRLIESVDDPIALLIEESDALKALAPRARSGHKGDFGHVLMRVGSIGMGGAAALAGLAAARAGAGLVTLAVPSSLASSYLSIAPELMTLPLDVDPRDRALTEDGIDRFLEKSESVDALLIGPGIGMSAWNLKFIERVLAESELVLTLDADALSALGSRAAELIGKRGAPTIVTPHPGEMARLISSSAEAVQADRLGVARRFAEESGAIVVLKGAKTIIVGRDGAARVNPVSSDALASGGSGDVLAGMIASFCSQGSTPENAAIAAVYFHAQSAERYVGAIGAARSMIATDIIDQLPSLLR